MSAQHCKSVCDAGDYGLLSSKHLNDVNDNAECFWQESSSYFLETNSVITINLT